MGKGHSGYQAKPQGALYKIGLSRLGPANRMNNFPLARPENLGSKVTLQDFRETLTVAPTVCGLNIEHTEGTPVGGPPCARSRQTPVEIASPTSFLAGVHTTSSNKSMARAGDERSRRSLPRKGDGGVGWFSLVCMPLFFRWMAR